VGGKGGKGTPKNIPHGHREDRHNLGKKEKKNPQKKKKQKKQGATKVKLGGTSFPHAQKWGFKLT